jgi:hypothetical protein
MILTSVTLFVAAATRSVQLRDFHQIHRPLIRNDVTGNEHNDRGKLFRLSIVECWWKRCSSAWNV